MICLHLFPFLNLSLHIPSHLGVVVTSNSSLISLSQIEIMSRVAKIVFVPCENTSIINPEIIARIEPMPSYFRQRIPIPSSFQGERDIFIGWGGWGAMVLARIPNPCPKRKLKKNWKRKKEREKRKTKKKKKKKIVKHLFPFSSFRRGVGGEACCLLASTSYATVFSGMLSTVAYCGLL